MKKTNETTSGFEENDKNGDHAEIIVQVVILQL